MQTKITSLGFAAILAASFSFSTVAATPASAAQPKDHTTITDGTSNT